MHHRCRRESAPANAGGGRLLSLDVFRGVTILAMILVNNPGEWGSKSQYWPVAHAEWHGWTPTDLIFPFFLFIVGTSLAYSMRKYRDGAKVQPAVYWRIVRRTALLIFLGWMPTLLLKTIAAFQGETFDLSNLRIYGVLVRIAIVYFCNVADRASRSAAAGSSRSGFSSSLGYWMLLAWHPQHDNYATNLSNEGNVVGLFDRSTIGPSHMYTYDRETKTLREPTEPEGFLSTFPAIVTALIGYWAGLFIQRRGVNYRTVVIAVRLRFSDGSNRPRLGLCLSNQQETLDQQFRPPHRRARYGVPRSLPARIRHSRLASPRAAIRNCRHQCDLRLCCLGLVDGAFPVDDRRHDRQGLDLQPLVHFMDFRP